MGAYYTPEDRRPPMTPQLALRVAVSASSRSRCSRSSSSASGTCRCWPATSTSPRPTRTARATCRIQAPRGDIVDRNGSEIVDQPPGQRRPAQPAVAARGGARRRRRLGPGRPTKLGEREAAHARRAAAAPHPQATARRCRPSRRCPPALDARFTRSARSSACARRRSRSGSIRRSPCCPTPAITLRVDVAGSMLDYLEERQDRVPRRRCPSRSTCATTRARRWPPSCWATSARSRPSS